MKRPPSRLFVRGNLPNGPRIAVVGTRGPSVEAERYAEWLAARLCERGASVWSGGAVGIDTAAHKGALRAGGSTVVVMGSGLEMRYPRANERLFQEVLESGGAWLSLLDDHCSARAWTFLWRNELLAAMTDQVVVVQAPLRSGARSTAAAARAMNKPVWVVPSPPWDTANAGAIEELRLGARPLTSPEQLLDSGELTIGAFLERKDTKSRSTSSTRQHQGLHPVSNSQENESPAEVELNELERSVVRAVDAGNRDLDSICRHTGIDPSAVSSTLLILTLRRILLESAEGLYYVVQTLHF